VNAWLELVAVLTCVALVLTALRPGLAVSLVILRPRPHSVPKDSAQVHVSRIAGSPNESRWKG
jgi:hypothetical protein